MTGSDVSDIPLTQWMSALEKRHLADLRVQEMTRALRALSSIYVERRGALGRGAALDSAGKRAAFALFYGPLHYLITRHIVLALDAVAPTIDAIVDLGCGTGAAGAAWAVALSEGGRREVAGEEREAEDGRREAAGGARQGGGTRVLGVDRHPWAVEEARWTYRTLGLRGAARRDDAGRTRIEGRRRAIVLAFTASELTEEGRQRLLPPLIRCARDGGRVLVIEPIARPVGTWWEQWAEVFRQAGGREDTWRAEAELPERVRQLDRAAGLDHRVLTGRSLYLSAEQSG